MPVCGRSIVGLALVDDMTQHRIERHLDREEITWVLNEYCHALDSMDLPRLRALFTDDCRVEYGPEPWLQSRGAENLQVSLARMWRWARTSHHLSNVQIDFPTDDEALARSYVHAWHERPDGSTATIFGQYHDRLVRRSAGWRIAERRMVMNGNDSGFAVNIHRFERIPPPVDWSFPVEGEKPNNS